MKDIPLIMLQGKLTGETSYRLDVSGFPSRDHARQFAALIAGYAAQAMNEIMGSPASRVVAGGPGATDEVKADLEAKSGAKVDTIDTIDNPSIAAMITATMREALAEMKEADDCQCPGCVARRDHEAKLAAGSKSDAKH